MVNRSRQLFVSRPLVRFGWRRYQRQDQAHLSWIHTLPPASQQKELIDALGDDVRPRVVCDGPVLFTRRRAPDGGEVWHLVNYAASAQRVTLRAPGFVSALVYAPDEAKVGRVFGDSLIVRVHRYKVLRISPEQAE